ncbi:uncharacterized protein Pyn_01935 [Prunus yedoensis var. nudiflora]|uniref:Uncharacterized protein n=1 Tax=Prunus yedoensis var. nudiflora TaxID=2094558 RepID=A0A314Z417_PRUYE|nr:uncharacterized protein Pyn_01935 [Prunus yedoensis var. nudiflora]
MIKTKKLYFIHTLLHITCKAHHTVSHANSADIRNTIPESEFHSPTRPEPTNPTLHEEASRFTLSHYSSSVDPATHSCTRRRSHTTHVATLQAPKMEKTV